MIDVIISAVVQYGRFAEFVAAFHRYDAARRAAGVPAYRLLTHAGSGRVNEVFLLTSYDDRDQIEAADRRASNEPEMAEPLREMLATAVPGSIRELHLAPVQ